MIRVTAAVEEEGFISWDLWNDPCDALLLPSTVLRPVIIKHGYDLFVFTFNLDGKEELGKNCFTTSSEPLPAS